MADKTFLFAGLGNPGSNYAKTWHNLGFFVLDELAKRNFLDFKSGRGDFFYSDFRLNGSKVILLKPTTYMNNSGRAIKQGLAYFNLEITDLVVIYDEISLPLGNIRLREAGSAGGHNGLKSAINHLGSQDFARLRVGFSNNHIESVLNRDRSRLPDLVLAKIPGKLEEDVEITVKSSADCLEELTECDFKIVMNKYNKRNRQEKAEE